MNADFTNIVREAAVRFEVPPSTLFSDHGSLMSRAARHWACRQAFKQGTATTREIANEFGLSYSGAVRILTGLPRDVGQRFTPITRNKKIEDARQLAMAVCARHGETLHALIKRNRRARMVGIRSEVVRRLRTEMSLSSTEIGHIIHRHHSTVLYLLGLTDHALRNGIDPVE